MGGKAEGEGGSRERGKAITGKLERRPEREKRKVVVGEVWGG